MCASGSILSAGYPQWRLYGLHECFLSLKDQPIQIRREETAVVEGKRTILVHMMPAEGQHDICESDSRDRRG